MLSEVLRCKRKNQCKSENIWEPNLFFLKKKENEMLSEVLGSNRKNPCKSEYICEPIPILSKKQGK
jgi:hypothetical protein